MSTIVTRAAKGSPLTHAEVDANFTNLNNDKFQEGNAIGNTTPAAGTFTTLTGNGTSQFGRSSANYIQATGNTTTNSPEISALGSDTNIPLTLESKGTGAINLAVGSRGVNVSNGMTVTAITRTGAGSGYTSVPTLTISAPTTAGGVTATASPLMAITSGTQTINNGGTGYTAGDSLTVSGGTGTAVTFSVATVSGGVITGLTITGSGAYSALPTFPATLTGGTGSGATVTFSFSIATATATITNAGSGYVEQPTVTFSGGGGSGAAAYATVGSTTVIRSIAGANTNSFEFYTPSNISNSQASFAIRDSGGAQSAYPVVWSGGDIRMYPAGGTNIDFRISSAGTGAVRLTTNGTSFVEQLRVAHTASAVNYVQVTGRATGNGPTISAQGSDTNIDLNLTTKGTGVVNLNTGNGTALRAADISGTIVAGLGVFAGSSSQNTVYLTTYGTVTNGNFVIASKGTQYVSLQTNSNNGSSATEQFRVSHTASAVNYVQVTGAATGAGPIISAQGSDTSAELRFRSKNVFNIRLQNGAGNDGLVVDMTSGATLANYISVAPKVASTSPVISVLGSDTNIDLNLTTKGTGAVKLNTGSGEQFRVADLGGTADSYIQAKGGSSATAGVYLSVGGAARNLYISNGAGSNTRFFTNGEGSAEQLRIAHTASAVNYVQVTGGATGVTPVISAQGSDSNVAISLVSKGIAAVSFLTNSSIQFDVYGGVTAVNRIRASGSVAGSAPSFSCVGSDTNIDLALTPKGTGLVRFGTRTATSDVAITGYLEIKDSGGTTRKLAIID